MLAAARNREATARVAWSPYMHNPKLKARLHRIACRRCFSGAPPTASSSMPSYGRAFAAAFPARGFETIERAGHYPHIEQPEEFARRALAFAERRRRPGARRADA